jgi:hypothetical protein
MMTREQQLKAATKLLGKESRDDVEDVLTIDGFWQVVEIENARDEKSKATRDALKSYLAALRKAELAYNNLPYHYQMIHFRDGNFKAQQALVKKLLAEPAANPWRNSDVKKLWAKAALKLIRRYERPESAKRNGYWCTLSAILYGDQSADFYHVCCDIKRPKPRSK